MPMHPLLHEGRRPDGTEPAASAQGTRPYIAPTQRLPKTAPCHAPWCSPLITLPLPSQSMQIACHSRTPRTWAPRSDLGAAVIAARSSRTPAARWLLRETSQTLPLAPAPTTLESTPLVFGNERVAHDCSREKTPVPA